MTTLEAATSPPQQTKEPQRPPRPNPNKIHSKPFPLTTYPLPPLIPHNPFSLLHIAFTYLSQSVSPPSSHPKTPYIALWSPETSSVQVTDDGAIRALWESGFFGKGSLSRSEPSWLEREKKKQGLIGVQTSEDFTKQRREERKRFKKERAKKEREAIEEKIQQEKVAKSNGHATAPMTARAEYEGIRGRAINSAAESVECLIALQPDEPLPPLPLLPAEPRTIDGGDETKPPVALEKTNRFAGNAQQRPPPQSTESASATPLKNEEHLQLTPTEAFFLTYAFGILNILSPTINLPLSTTDLLTLFTTHSTFPSTPSLPISPPPPPPDSPFLLHYTTYHHFRSHGHTVRPGLKFGIDHLLYTRGPVFSHAEFGVLVLPAYVHPYWRATEERRREVGRKEVRAWEWVSAKARVLGQVRKTLVVAWVEVPATGEVEEVWGEGGGGVDVGRLLKLYKIREVIMKRWIPNRERD